MGVEKIEPGELERLTQSTPRRKRKWVTPETARGLLEVARQETAHLQVLANDHDRAIGKLDTRLRAEVLQGERARLAREYADKREPHLTRLALFKAEAQDALEVWANPKVRMMMHRFDPTNEANDATIRLATMTRLSKMDPGRLIQMARVTAAQDQHALAGAIVEEIDSRTGFDRNVAAEIRGELGTISNPSEGIERMLQEIVLEHDQHRQHKIATGLQRERMTK